MTVHKLFAPRRIGVCGSSRGLPREAVPFCEGVGRRLAQEPYAVIVSGGSKRRSGAAEGDLAADWYIVSAAERALPPDMVTERIETVFSEERSTTEQFDLGSSKWARGKTRQARRFAFVRIVDALFAVGGGSGTAQELALATELGVPVLPAPLFGGTAKEVWVAYRNELLKDLRIDEATAGRWEESGQANSEQLRKLAFEMVKALLDSLPRHCFVIMPFAEDFTGLYDFVIEPAIRNAGHEPIRLDRAAVPGDVGRQIHDGIRACDYAIAVLDGLRANVLYELGLAHGRGKPTILINRIGALTDHDFLPFDLSMQQRLEYHALEASLVKRLQAAIESMPNHQAVMARTG